MQIKGAFGAGIADSQSMVVCAPTSGGKTLVAEIAVLKALQNHKRCIYFVSHKALADQKYLDFERRFGFEAPNPIATVGLSTGDREEGDAAPQLLVATYEKGLARLLSGQIEPNAALVVADELQIIGEPGRGPNIETLCAILRQRNLHRAVCTLRQSRNRPRSFRTGSNAATSNAGRVTLSLTKKYGHRASPIQ